jgi:hypothetical protein
LSLLLLSFDWCFFNTEGHGGFTEEHGGISRYIVGWLLKKINIKTKIYSY